MLGQLSPLQIETVLRSECIGRIGLHAGGRTYVVPVTYVYDGESVIGHTGEGLKVTMARENPKVCFEVEHLDNLANWQSVICQGTFIELSGAEAGATMHRFIDHMLPLMTSATSEPTHGLQPGQASAAHQHDVAGHKSVTWRLALTEKSGRFEKR
jgi:nitroimidazol reductase NimA-like FMN-containing flavoprotein (pyridoxamine 5'-phosphate oxidase superfamily)